MDIILGIIIIVGGMILGSHWIYEAFKVAFKED